MLGSSLLKVSEGVGEGELLSATYADAAAGLESFPDIADHDIGAVLPPQTPVNADNDNVQKEDAELLDFAG